VLEETEEAASAGPAPCSPDVHSAPGSVCDCQCGVLARQLTAMALHGPALCSAGDMPLRIGVRAYGVCGVRVIALAHGETGRERT